jgi:PAS domain S-box-containing protein
MATAVELLALSKSGREFPVEISLSPLPAEEGLLVSSAIRDVSERKRAEELIHHNEQFRSAVLDAIPAEVAVLDRDGGITTVNEPWNRFGRENMLPGGAVAGVGVNYLEVVRKAAEADSPLAREALDGLQAILNGEINEFRLEYPCDSEAEQRWFLMHAIAAPTAVGGLIVAHSNISQLKNAELALRANDELLRTLIEAIPDTVQVKDSRGRWMVANEAALQLFELGKVEWLGKSDEELAGLVSAEIAADLRSCQVSDPLVWSRAQAVREMVQLRQVNGSVRTFDVIKVPLWNSDSQPRLLVVVGRDITAQKNAEAALRERNEELETVMREVPVAIFIGQGADSHLITGNPAARRLLRIPAAAANFSASLPGNGFEIHRVGETNSPIQLPMQQAAATGEAVLETELDVIFSDGGRCRILGNAVPLFDEKGRVRGSIGTFIDISELKLAEDALRDFNASLETRVKERTDVLEQTTQDLREEIAGRQRLEAEILQISERQQMRIGQDLHDDLGQQLVGIAILAEVLSRELQAQSHPTARDAARLAESLRGSIKTTRNLAKSYYPVELERAGLVAALQDLAERTQLLTKVTCTVTAGEGFAVEKSAEIHLYRIVQESISNAIKHGHATRITIACVREGDTCTLTIADDGSEFTLTAASAQRPGMGMHLFQYRARLFGGSVTVRSGDGGGCDVICSLPVITPWPPHPPDPATDPPSFP